MTINNTKKEASCRLLEEVLKDSRQKFAQYVEDFHKKEISFPKEMRKLIQCNTTLGSNIYFFNLRVFACNVFFGLNDNMNEEYEYHDAKEFIEKNPQMLVFPLNQNVDNRINPHLLVGKSRYAFSFGDGFMGKVKPNFCLPHYLKYGFYLGIAEYRPHLSKEEFLFQQMQKHGFTTENGFLLPFHYGVSIDLDHNQLIHVSVAPAVYPEKGPFPKGVPCTITEDMSLGYDSVEDISSYHFTYLKNRIEFTASYVKHMGALIEFFKLPQISSTICRTHSGIEEKVDSVLLALSRMLLVRIKDRVGEIFIGDLDHLSIVPGRTYKTDPDEDYSFNVGKILESME